MPVKHVLVSTPILVALLVVLVGGYVLHWSWTGYRTAPAPATSAPQTRTLWDWLEMALLPVTLALTPIWLRSRGRLRRQWTRGLLVGASVFCLLVVSGYALHWAWTGFPGNTVWDWLQLFLVPFALPVVFHFVGQEEQRDPGDEASTREGADGDAPSGTGRKPRGGTAAWGGGLAAAVCLLVAVAWITGAGPGRVAASSSTTGARGQPPVRSVTVDGRDPMWTDTGLSVVPGERVHIVGVGWVLPGPAGRYRYASPAGLPHPRPGERSIDTAVKHAALIATVAPASHPVALDGTRAAAVLPVGKDRVLAVHGTGELLLGINDRKTSDNTGSFNVTVSVRGGT